MGYLSDFAENELLDHVLMVGSYSRPTNLYLAFCYADPTDAGTGITISEPTDVTYVRQACDGWTIAASRATSNTGAITFPACGANWSSVTHFAIVDSVTTGLGNMLAYGPITPNKTYSTGNIPSVAIGDLDISFNVGGVSNFLANSLLDHLFEGTAYTPPTGIWAALATVTITDAMTGTTITEPGQNYARIQHDTWHATVAGISTNDGAITYATVTGGTWGTITDTCLCDAVTVGNMLFYDVLTTAQTIELDDIGLFLDTKYEVTMD